MSTTKTITWTPDKLVRFKRYYGYAVKDKAETFIFDEDEYLTTYAEYLIEYLEGAMK